MLFDVMDEVASERDPQIEAQMLGAMILDSKAIDAVSARLRSTDFFNVDFGHVYDALCTLREMGKPTDDPRLLAQSLKKLGLLGKGKPLQVADIAKWVSVARPAYAIAYAEEIITVSQCRMQIEAVCRSIDNLMDRNEPPEASAQKLLTRLESIYARTNIELTTIHEAGKKAVDAIRAAMKKATGPGISTSIYALDNMMGGLFQSELIILAARPAVGKTALAMQICHSAAVFGKNVLFVSLEMRDLELASRVCCADSGVNGKHIRQGTVSEDEINRLLHSAEGMANLQLSIYAPPRAGLRQIKAAMRAASFRNKLDLVCVDYLQLIDPDDKKRQRSEQVAEISRGLKQLAKEFEVPVLALCQLSREAEGNIPTLAHLRESGSIEQDADVVLAIHRGTDDTGKNTAQLILLKQRQGEVGTVEVIWRPEATRFEEPVQQSFI